MHVVPGHPWRMAPAACLVVVVGLVVAACSSGPIRASGGGDPSTAGGPVVFHATITVTGEIHAKESFTDKTTAKKVASCARAAAHGNRPRMGPNTWLVPTPPLDNPVEVEIGTKARGYHGPGHYPQGVLAQGNGAMDVGPESYDLTSADATASMTVKPDGSGDVTFTHVPGDDDSPHKGWHGGIAGTIGWTCSS